MPGFWDSEAVKNAAAGSNDYVKFVSPGDSVEGTIAKLGTRTFNEGKADERIAFEVIFTDAPTLTAGQMLLMQGLAELRPEPGDRLYVEYAEMQRVSGTNTMKRWLIRVTRANGEVIEIDQRQSAESDAPRIISNGKAPRAKVSALRGSKAVTQDDNPPPF